MTATKGNKINASDILTATEIANTYIKKSDSVKSISASGSTLTLTKGDGTTSTVTVSGGGTSLSSNVTASASTSVTVASIETYSNSQYGISFYTSAATVLSKGNALSSSISPKPQASSAPSQGQATGAVVATDKVNISTNITAGTYTLQSLLDKLAQCSHTHKATRTLTIVNCECDCDCSDSG